MQGKRDMHIPAVPYLDNKFVAGAIVFQGEATGAFDLVTLRCCFASTLLCLASCFECQPRSCINTSITVDSLPVHPSALTWSTCYVKLELSHNSGLGGIVCAFARRLCARCFAGFRVLVLA